MNELKDKLQELKKRFDGALALVNLEYQKKQLAKLQTEMSQPNFWADQNKAKSVGQEASSIENEIKIWEKFQTDLLDTLELLELDMRDHTVNLHDDIATHYEELLKQFATLERNLLFGEKYDTKSAIIMINAGSGGTDAQDWAEMLLRMYLRFCEKQGWKTSITSISEGQEAGIKSVQFEVEGRYAYGHLKGEHGVHRLVRISPYDAEKMRHTSFAMVEVLPLLDNEVNIEIKPEELRIDTYRAGGHGGQSVNTTDSAVRITHLPTGITVQCQNERSQMQNKDKALSHLKSKLQRYYETEIEEERQRLRGEYTEAAWGNQARSYVLHPYKLVKDHRTDFESTEAVKILDGDIIEFVEAYLRKVVSSF